MILHLQKGLLTSDGNTSHSPRLTNNVSQIAVLLQASMRQGVAK